MHLALVAQNMFYTLCKKWCLLGPGSYQDDLDSEFPGLSQVTESGLMENFDAGPSLINPELYASAYSVNIS